MSGSKFRAFLRMDLELTDRCTDEASGEELRVRREYWSYFAS